MITLNIAVTGTAAVIENPAAVLTTGLKGARCCFTFDEAWNGLQKTAVFASGRGQTDVILPDTNICVIPFERLDAAEGGRLRIGVYGTTADGTTAIPTVYTATQAVKRGAEPGGADPDNPQPPIWITLEQQCAEAISDANQAAANANNVATAVRTAAANGEFDGAPGEQGPKGDKGDPGEPRTVDQTFDMYSTNPQSGTAVNEGITGYVDQYMMSSIADMEQAVLENPDIDIYGIPIPTAVIKYVLSKLKPELKWHKTTYTVSEDNTTQIIIDDIEWQGVKILFSAPIASSTSKVVFEGLNNSGMETIQIVGEEYLSNANATYGTAQMQLKNGMWEISRTAKATSKGSNWSNIYSSSFKFASVTDEEYPAIIKLRIRSSIALPIGTTFDIWGLY